MLEASFKFSDNYYMNGDTYCMNGDTYYMNGDIYYMNGDTYYMNGGLLITITLVYTVTKHR